MRGAIPHHGQCRRLALAALAAAFWAAPSRGAPQIGYAYPAGGRRGTTVRVEVGGQGLQAVDGARVSGEGVSASVVESVRPLTNEELRRTERFLRDLVRRRWSVRAMDEAARDAGEPPLPDHPWLRDIEDRTPVELDRLRKRLFDPKRQPNAQIAEQVIVEVAIAPDAAPGDRELRLTAPGGISNPVCFQVGTLPEVRETELGRGPGARAADTPAVINGQILPGEVDRIPVRARAGQKLLFRLQARALIPYLADAVPGWFQAVMALRDPGGREVAWNDDWRFDPDPVLFYEVPADGVYELEVRDAIYRGRDDFVYRIAAGELPFVTEVFPLGGQEGTPAMAAVRGWNLPGEAVPLDTRPGGGALRRAVVRSESGYECPVPYLVDPWAEVSEAEPNDAPGEAQQIAVPQAVNGRIGQPGDVDRFRFEGRAGQVVVAEVYARRVGSPLDSRLVLTDAEGVEVAANDDSKDPEQGLITHHADACLRAELPRDGAYCLCLSEVTRQGGSAYAYRLQVRPPQPDFALRVVPSAVAAGPGQAGLMTVHVLRRDGFEGPVRVTLAEAPEGFRLRPLEIPAGQASAEARLIVPRGTPRQAAPIRLAGEAEIGGATVRRTALPAEDMMQAFLWRFLVPRQEMLAAVAGPRPVPAVWRPLVPGMKLAGAGPAPIPLGGTASVDVICPDPLPDAGQTPLSALRFRVLSQPRGITLREAAAGNGGVRLAVKADRNTALTGDAGNVIVEVSAELPGASGRTALGVLPAIPYVVVNP